MAPFDRSASGLLVPILAYLPDPFHVQLVFASPFVAETFDAAAVSFSASPADWVEFYGDRAMMIATGEQILDRKIILGPTIGAGIEPGVYAVSP